MEPKQLIIVAVKGKMHKQIFGPALVSVIASERKRLKDSGNWKGWLLQIRTPAGYKEVQILTKKPKTYEEKRAA
jgi:hypothetical protein